MQTDIMKELSCAGLLFSTVSASHVPELKVELEELNRDGSGMVSPDLYTGLMSFFEFVPPENMTSIIIVAIPVPITRLAFALGGSTLQTTLPPTYAEYFRIQPEVEEQLNGILAPHGYHAVWAKNLPNKIVAAHSGLSQYGRNNICYTQGTGSFASIACYYTDMPCETDHWQPITRMELCQKCTLCMDNCPTGAITKDKQVIDANRCLTNLNEEPGDAFPDWMDPAAHNCLVGCMRCQSVCPKNADYLGRVSDIYEFDEEETKLIMANDEYELLPDALKGKLENLCLKWYYKTLPRNLQALIGNH